jgi:hypothetical protein
MMPQKSLTVLSTLLGRIPEERRATYLGLLPQDLTSKLQINKNPKEKKQDLSIKELLGKIDESWYLETLSSFSKKDLLFFLSLFPEKIRKKQAERLAIEGPFFSFSKEMELYFANLLFKELFKAEIPLPLSYLQDSPLLFLCSASSEKVNKLIFYLGLFDISAEIKSVLKGSILKSLEKTLFADEVNFCREISEFRHVVTFGQIGLNQWNEESDPLRQVIFERGLYRLSLALTDAQPDLLWHITHSLKKPFAEKLQKTSKATIDTHVITIILEQIQAAWKGVCTVLN